jgi:hypothetical protein
MVMTTLKLFTWTPLYKAAITGLNPTWAVQNIFVDQVFVWLRNPLRYDKPWKFWLGAPIELPKQFAYSLKGIYSAIRKNKDYQDFILNGAGMGTQTEMGGLFRSHQYERSQDYNLGGGNPAQWHEWMNRMNEFLGYAGKVSEYGTRIGLMKRLKAHDPKMTTFQAAMQARENMDYMQAGNFMRIMDPFFPYINVGVLAANGMLQSGIKDKWALAYKSLMLVGVGMLEEMLYEAGNSADDDDDETTRKIKTFGETINPRTRATYLAFSLPRYLDSKIDRVVTPFIKIKQDQYARMFISGGRNYFRSLMDRPIDWEEQIYATLDNIPVNVTGSLGPPSANFFSALANFDTRRREKIYKGPEYTPWKYESTAYVKPAYVPVSKINLSPPRTQAAVDAVLGNHFLKSLGEFSYQQFAASGEEKNTLNQAAMEGLQAFPFSNMILGSAKGSPRLDDAALALYKNHPDIPLIRTDVLGRRYSVGTDKWFTEMLKAEGKEYGKEEEIRSELTGIIEKELKRRNLSVEEFNHLSQYKEIHNLMKSKVKSGEISEKSGIDIQRRIKNDFQRRARSTKSNFIESYEEETKRFEKHGKIKAEEE